MSNILPDDRPLPFRRVSQITPRLHAWLWRWRFAFGKLLHPAAGRRHHSALDFVAPEMNPRDYLVQASELVRSESPSAADLRTAVSRSYYATFNVALALLKKTGVKVPDGWEGHKLVAEALRYTEDPQLQAAASELDDLRKARWKADYDMEDDEVEHQRTVEKRVARAK